MSFGEYSFGEVAFAAEETVGDVVELTVDLELDNAIEAAVSRDWSFPYRIVNGVETDIILDWEIEGGLSVDLVLDHSIISQVAKDLEIQYTITGGLSKDLVFDYEITTDIFTEIELQWYVQGRTDSIVGTNKLCPGKESRKLKICG